MLLLTGSNKAKDFVMLLWSAPNRGSTSIEGVTMTSEYPQNGGWEKAGKKVDVVF